MINVVSFMMKKVKGTASVGRTMPQIRMQLATFAGL